MRNVLILFSVCILFPLIHSDTLSNGIEENFLDKIEKLKQTFEETILIEVVLVGFPKTSSNSSWTLTKKEVEYYLNQANIDRKVTVVKGFGENEKEEHELFIKRNFLFQVSEGSKNFHEKASSIVQSFVKRGESKIPHKLMDNLVKEEYEKEKDSSIRIYILFPSSSKLGFHSYFYSSNDEREWESCGTSLGMGGRKKERFLWLDVSTSLHNYGFLHFGQGSITPSLGIPSITRVRHLHDHGKLAANDFVVDVVSFIKRTCEYLISPSLSHYPLTIQKKVTFKLFILSENLVGGSKFDWNSIQKEIESIFEGTDMEMTFKKEIYSFKDCLHCNLILKYSTKMNRNGGKEEFYLDSEEAHFWLENFYEKFVTSEPDLVPIFLFDLSSTQHNLLDQVSQSVSFKNMIVAFQSLHFDHKSEYGCDGKQVKIDIQDATRSVLSSIFQSTFGILPSLMKWSSVHQKVSFDFLWSIGHSPGSIFSNSTQLSFTVADNSIKHVLYNQIQSCISFLNEVLFHYSNSDVKMSQVLLEHEYDQFLIGWNNLQGKVSQVNNHLSHFEYHEASKIIQSMFEDVFSLHAIVHDAGTRMEVGVICKDQPAPDSILWSLFKYALFVSPLVVGSFVGSSILAKKRKRK